LEMITVGTKVIVAIFNFLYMYHINILLAMPQSSDILDALITNMLRSLYCISQANASLLCAEANMLFLETPAGVGFSYSNDSSYYLGANDAKTGIKYQ